MSDCSSHFVASILLSSSLALAAGCAVQGAEEVHDPDAELAARLPVIFEGVTYEADDFDALGVHPVHFGVTEVSVRDGHVLAFSDEAERDRAVIGDRQVKGGTQNLLRHNSKFYADTSYGDKLLELGPGEASNDLALHPCNCRNQISSLKASDDALITRVYDIEGLTGDSWGIATGAEISNLGQYTHNGFSWNNDINSISVSW